jgi:intracellular septation protein
MMQLLELLPLIAFVASFRLKGETIEFAGMFHTFDGIYSATAILMATTVLQVMVVWLLKRKVETRLWWLLGAVLIFGGATLLLRDKAFIQWKPTVFNWALCLALLGSHWFTKKNLVERLLGQKLELPAHIYTRLTFVWAAYFLFVGALNLVIAYHFSEAFWVDYKLWSALLFTLVIATITSFMLAPYMKEDLPPSEPDD